MQKTKFSFREKAVEDLCTESGYTLDTFIRKSHTYCPKSFPPGSYVKVPYVR